MAAGLSCVAFTVLSYVPLFPEAESCFHHKRTLDFVKTAFSAPMDGPGWKSFTLFALIDLWAPSQPCPPEIHPAAVVGDPSNVSPRARVRILASVLIGDVGLHLPPLSCLTCLVLEPGRGLPASVSGAVRAGEVSLFSEPRVEPPGSPWRWLGAVRWLIPFHLCERTCLLCVSSPFSAASPHVSGTLFASSLGAAGPAAAPAALCRLRAPLRRRPGPTSSLSVPAEPGAATVSSLVVAPPARGQRSRRSRVRPWGQRPAPPCNPASGSAVGGWACAGRGATPTAPHRSPRKGPGAGE